MGLFNRRESVNRSPEESSEVNSDATKWENMAAEAPAFTPEYKYQPSDEVRAKHIRKIMAVHYTKDFNNLNKPKIDKSIDQFLDDFMDKMVEQKYSEKNEREFLSHIAKPKTEGLSEEEKKFAGWYKTVRDYEDYEHDWTANMTPEERATWLKASSVRKHNIYGKQVEYSEDLKYLRKHAVQKKMIQDKGGFYHANILDNN